MRVAKYKVKLSLENVIFKSLCSEPISYVRAHTLTLWLFEFVDKEFDGVVRLVDDEGAEHILEDLVETRLLHVLLASALEVNFLLFQHHGSPY